MSVLALIGFVVVAACGSVDEYSSDSIDRLEAAQAGIDPNRPSSELGVGVPEELAFVDGDQSTSTVVGTDSSLSLELNATDPAPTETSSSAGFAVDGSDAVTEQSFVLPLTPDADPSGRPYQRCVVDFGGIDWTADADQIVKEHSAASTLPCTSQSWYEATAFQNGILVSMVLAGEQELSDSTPSSAAAEATASSLIAQGYDDVERMEIASSGACENGEIQLALLHLRQGVDVAPTGLEEIVASANETGALVDNRNGLTLIAGGGSPCISGIVVKPGLVAWLTSRDASRLEQAAEFLTGS